MIASTSSITAASSTRLATTANSVPCWALSSPTAIDVIARRSAGLRPDPLSTSSTGAPRLAAMRALNENSVGALTSV